MIGFHARVSAVESRESAVNVNISSGHLKQPRASPAVRLMRRRTALIESLAVLSLAHCLKQTVTCSGASMQCPVQGHHCPRLTDGRREAEDG